MHATDRHLSAAQRAVDAAHDQLDRALHRYALRNPDQAADFFETRGLIQECVECADTGHGPGCLPHCKAVAKAWATVEARYADRDAALLAAGEN